MPGHSAGSSRKDHDILENGAEKKRQEHWIVTGKAGLLEKARVGGWWSGFGDDSP